MKKKFKLGFTALALMSLTGCLTYSSPEYNKKSCTSLKRSHDQVGRNVRALLVKDLKSRKSYKTAKIVSRSYSNWPIYFIVKGNDAFNSKLSTYKTKYQYIRTASLQNKCTYFRDMMATKAYKSADAKY